MKQLHLKETWTVDTDDESGGTTQLVRDFNQFYCKILIFKGTKPVYAYFYDLFFDSLLCLRTLSMRQYNISMKWSFRTKLENQRLVFVLRSVADTWSFVPLLVLVLDSVPGTWSFVPLFLYMYWFDIYMLLRHTLANIIFACLNIFDVWIIDDKKVKN